MTMIYTEGFETDGNGARYATSIPEFSDGAFDFFQRTDGSTIISSYELAGAEGSFYFAAQDIDGEGAAKTQTLTVSAIDISGYENLSFSGLFAEDAASDFGDDWDASDSVIFEFRIDGGAWTQLIAFENDGETFNGVARQDVDFDGTGEGDALSPTFTRFAAAIGETGTAMDFRVTFTLDSGDEDFALDGLEISGDAAGAFDLQVTEIWFGQDGDDVTGDWFEITNNGTASWTAGVDGDLFYDDDSQDAEAADLIEGLTSLGAGESAIVMIGDASDAATFSSVWSPVIDLTAVEVGYTDGSGLGSGGDGVTLFVEDGTQGDAALDDGIILDFEDYPDTDRNSGKSWDVDADAFAEAGVNGAVSTSVLGGEDGTEPAIASPGNGAVVVTEAAFTLELFHIADQEASTSAITNAPNMSAILSALQAEDLGDDGVADNSLFLSSGDAFIPGVFFSAGASVFGTEGIADIQIQNELGVQAIALGNHEFDLGTELLASLIDGTAIGDFSALTESDLAGLDFEGTDMSYLSTNLDYATDANLAGLEATGGASTGNTVSSSVVFDVNGEQIGVVGATTPTLGSISSPGDLGISPDWAGTDPTDAELDALAAEIQAEVDALLADNPSMNKVVLLAHMQQIEIEEALAIRLENVDIIVAGGSNTRLFDENDTVRDGDSVQGEYPNFITNAGGTQTVVVNTDGSYKYLGRLVIDFDADGNVIADSYDADVSGAYATTGEMVAELEAEDLIDPEIQAIVDAIEEQIIATESNVFGYSDVFLNGNRSGTFDADDTDGVRTQETNLGNLTADANLAAAKDIDDTVVLSIKNGGGIRASIGETIVPAGGSEALRSANAELVDGDGNTIKAEGGISQTDIQTALAFNNGLTLLTVTKAELIAVLEHGVSAIDSAAEGGVAGSFPQVSGVTFSYDDTLDAGARIIDAAIVDEDGSILTELMRDGVVVGDVNETFRIVTLNFMADGGDGYPFPTGNDVDRLDLFDLDGDDFDDGITDGVATFAENGTEQDALAEYLAENHGTVETAFDAADEGVDSDDRIQSVAYQDSTVYGDAVTGAAVFSYSQSFDLELSGGQYVDTGDAATDHDLTNNDGQALVDSDVSGIDIDGTLAFDASYVNSRDDVGLTDGDYVGVANYAGTVGAFTTGGQGYQMQDSDGQMILAFETVDTSGAGAVDVSIDVFFQETGWEADDFAQVGVDTDGDGIMDVMLLDTVGQDIDDLDIENQWLTLSTTLDGDVDEATLMVVLDSDSSSESLYLDTVSIETAPLESFTYTQTFEGEAANKRKYADPGDASVDHDLENATDPNMRIVDSVASGIDANGELAFDASWDVTRLDMGITTGMTDFTGTGVTDNLTVPGTMSQGQNGYLFKNTDGKVTLEFETIDSSAVDLVTVSIDAYITDVNWEKNKHDLIHFGVDTDGDGEIDVSMLDATKHKVRRQTDTGEWVTYSVDLVAPESVTFIVEFDSNLQNEAMMIDNLIITGESGVAGIPAEDAPEAQASLTATVASISTVAGGAEIVSFVPGENLAVVANGAGLSFYDVSDITNPILTGTEDPMDFGATSSDVTSVSTRATSGGFELAAAVPDATVTNNGVVIFADGENDYTIEVGALPDMVTFDETGDYLLVANEGQSADGDNAPDVTPNPDGSISIIQIERDGDGNPTGNFITNSYDFSDASITLAALEAKGVRINETAPSVAADIEPEFITMNGNTAYISLQENNAIAIIEDITTFTGFTIDNIVTAGSVDHLQIGNGIDASDDDGDTVNIQTQNVVGLNMPDGIVAFSVAGTGYFAGANEGDARGTDEDRVSDLVLDPTAYPDAATDQLDENLGRLTVSTIDGDTDGDGDIDQLTSFGSRSFSIYDAAGNEVFNSGDLLARIVLAEQGEDTYPDSRSDAKGVEPEYVEFGEINGKPYLFVGLERADAVVVFDITDPENPVYDQFIDLPEVDAPEGLEFVSAENSPNGTPLLIVAGEGSDALAIIELNREVSLTSIGDVQGSGTESALVGEEVTVHGVVVGEYSADDQLTGFYIQSTNAAADGDAATSDGVFVYLGDATGELPDVVEGDLVTLTGTVDEYFGQTQIDTLSSLTVEASDQLDLVSAARMVLPGTGSYEAEATYEQYEGMLVTIPQELFVSEFFELVRYGQVVLTEGERPFQYTQQNAPDVDGYAAYLEELGKTQIILDDDNNADSGYTGDDDTIAYGDGDLSVDNYFRGGDSITDLTGVLTWGWAGSSGTDAWRLRPTEANEITFESVEDIELTPDDILGDSGSLIVASFNVLNYFTTLNDGSASVNGDPRGANSEAELDQQTGKLVSAMLTMDADVFGLVEIENEFGDQNGDGTFAVQYLADALNAAAGSEIYDWVDPGVGTVDSTDVITGAFIYDTTTVEVTAGSTVAILNDTTNPLDFDNAVFDGVSTNRAALAVSFTELATGESFTASVNHFKSKGSVNSADGNTDANDGAGNNNAIRLQAAQSLDAWLESDPTGAGDARTLILGDLNAYAMEDPITYLEAEGYTDLARAFEGDDAYSYLFDSQLGTLDYAMSNDALSQFVTGATEWHINADELVLFDYNDDVLDTGEPDYEEEPGGTDLFNDDPFRTSDHDPVLIGLDLDGAVTTDGFELV